jgi:hypothetical protein
VVNVMEDIENAPANTRLVSLGDNGTVEPSEIQLCVSQTRDLLRHPWFAAQNCAYYIWALQ